MKKYLKIFILSVFVSALPFATMAATFQFAEERLHIAAPVVDDIYAAGGQARLDSDVLGDLFLAGGELLINGDVLDDIFALGGRVLINGNVGDDVRVAGGEIEIRGKVEDDVIVVGGGTVRILADAEIGGDLIVNAGELRIEGLIKGNLIANAGRILLDGSVEQNVEMSGGVLELNGSVGGFSTLIADQVVLGPAVSFANDIEYWTARGEVDFALADANYNADLGGKYQEWDGVGGDLMIIFALLSFLSGVLIMALLVTMRKFYTRSAVNFKELNWKSFAFGILYFALTPVVVFVFIISIIGIPLGLLLLVLYIFSFVFALPVTALTVASFGESYYQKTWNNWQYFGVAILVYALLKLVLLIPLIGILFVVFLVLTAFGAIILEKAKILKNVKE